MSLVRRVLADGLGMPREVVMDAPRLVWVGRDRATVVNHRGLLWFSPDRVCVATSAGPLWLYGQALEVATVKADWLAVSGQIGRVAYAE